MATIEGEIELWADIEEYKGIYQISHFGNVKSLDRTIVRKNLVNQILKGKILKTHYDTKGYLKIGLCSLGCIRKNFSIHRLVAKAFIENPNNLPTVDHIDRNKANNSVSNLRWANYSTQNLNKQNVIDAKYYTIYFCSSRPKKKWCIHWYIGKRKGKYFMTKTEAEDYYQQTLKYLDLERQPKKQ
jgi:hypothetical protein